MAKEAWPDRAIVQGALAQITWYQNVALLERLDTSQRRLWYWYAAKSVEQGWSRHILAAQTDARARLRQGKALSNLRPEFEGAQWETQRSLEAELGGRDN